MTIAGTRPHVYAAGQDLGKRFDFSDSEMHGLGLRKRQSYHPVGRAIDFMTKDKAKGDSLAEWVRSHAAEYGAIEVIWWQRIWSARYAGEGWRAMSDRGSATENHYDHVHVSFAAEPGTGIPTGATTGSGSSSSGCVPALLAATVGSIGWIYNLYAFLGFLGG